MKTVDDYIDKYFSYSPTFVSDIIKERDQEIKDLVDEMIKKINNFDRSDPTKDYYFAEKYAELQTAPLTELKQKIQGLSVMESKIKDEE